MDISVIICTWNNSKRLAITLEAISQCIIPKELNWEIVIVNNNCTDDTDKIIRALAEKLPFVYVKELQQGLSRARNKGLEVAKGKLIIFTDDDVKPCQEWLSSYWAAYQEKPEGFFFGGPVESEFEISNFDRDLLLLAPSSVKGLSWENNPRILNKDEYFIGANWACPSYALKDSGSFDINKGLNASPKIIIIGEEADLMDRLKELGLTPWYLPTAKLLHFVPKYKLNLKHISARWESEGYTIARENMVNFQLHLIFGIPRWMFRRIFVLWKKWILTKLIGKKAYREYRRFRGMIGIMKATRENYLQIIFDKSKNKLLKNY